MAGKEKLQKALVTGGAGFIGSHVADALVEKGLEVVVLDDLSSGNKGNVNGRARFVEKSILSDMRELFYEEKFDYVFHLAAHINLRDSFKNPGMDATINIGGSLNVIENCVRNNVKKLVFSSTGGAIYSPDAPLPCDESALVEPASPYGIAKRAVESYLGVVKENKGLEYVCLRYSNVYGPRQNAKGEAGVVSIFATKALRGEPLVIFGDGKQTRDLVYVKDVAAANILAIERGLMGVYNVSTCIETDVNSLAGKIKELANSSSEIRHVDEVKGELKRSCLCSAKLSRYGWTPKYSLDEGLRETVDYFRGQAGK